MPNQPTNFDSGITGTRQGAQNPTWAIDQYGNAKLPTLTGDITFTDTLTVTGAFKANGTASAKGGTFGTAPTGVSGKYVTLGYDTSADVGFVTSSNWGTGFTDLRIQAGTTTLYGSSSIIASFSATAVNLNSNGDDIDVKILSDSNANHFVSDAGLLSGVGAFGFGSVADAGQHVLFAAPALTSTANQPFYRVFATSSGAVTVPAGTSSVVATVAVGEPNITATGTVNDAYSLYVIAAPTEGTRNGAFWVASGTSRFDDRVQAKQGADVASANTITLGNGNHFGLTGTTQVNLITTTGWAAGAAVTLFMNSAVTIAHDQTAAGATAGILMGSAGSYVGHANDLVTLVLTSTATALKWVMQVTNNQ